jgi:hypothetical protein
MADEAARSSAAFHRLIVIAFLAGGLTLFIPGWREVVATDLSLILPLNLSEIVFKGLGDSCRPLTFPQIDMASRHGEFITRSPDQVWVTRAADHWLDGVPTSEEREAGVGVAIAEAVRRCYSTYRSERARELIHWAEQQEPGNGFLLMAELQLEGSRGPISRDFAQYEATLERALALQPWDLHVADECRARREAFYQAGYPRHVPLGYYPTCGHEIRSIEFSLRYVPTALVQRGLDSRDPAKLAHSIELALGVTQVRWSEGARKIPFWSGPNSDSLFGFHVERAGDALAKAASDLGLPATGDNQQSLALTFLRDKVSSDLIARLRASLQQESRPLIRSEEVPMPPPRLWLPLQESFVVQFLLFVGLLLLALPALLMHHLRTGAAGSHPIRLTAFVLGSMTWLYCRCVYPFLCGPCPEFFGDSGSGKAYWGAALVGLPISFGAAVVIMAGVWTLFRRRDHALLAGVLTAGILGTWFFVAVQARDRSVMSAACVRGDCPSETVD